MQAKYSEYYNKRGHKLNFLSLKQRKHKTNIKIPPLVPFPRLCELIKHNAVSNKIKFNMIINLKLSLSIRKTNDVLVS